jgi:hypothetical protein
MRDWEIFDFVLTGHRPTKAGFLTPTLDELTLDLPRQDSPRRAVCPDAAVGAQATRRYSRLTFVFHPVDALVVSESSGEVLS